MIRNSSLMKKSSPELVRIIFSQTALIDANNTKKRVPCGIKLKIALNLELLKLFYVS